jgi:hypothetical protein
MMFRRITGVLTAVCMLHLSFVASDAACAAHMSSTHMSSTHMSSAHGMSGGMPMASGPADMDATMAGDAAAGEKANRHQCDTPAQADCCHAFASCTPTFAATGLASGLPAIERGEVPQSVIDMPLSELVAPATPPPKL